MNQPERSDHSAPAPGPSAPPGAYRRLTPRKMWVFGSSALAVLTVVGALVGWQAQVRVSAALDHTANAWRNADGIMGMDIGSLKHHWAMNLAEHGMSAEAEQARRDGATAFRAQMERVRRAGLNSPSELQAIERLFGELETLSRDTLTTGPDAASGQRISAAQAELDQMLTDLEARGDERMEQEITHTRTLVRHAVQGLAAVVLAVFLVAMGAGAWLLRWVFRSLTHPVHAIARSTEQLREAAQYQVSSAAEQSSATVQISSTMQELLASYRNMTQKSRSATRATPS
jgi:hypothetical protein